MAKISKDKLAAMSKDEKLKYLDALREKKRRAGLIKKKYVPNDGQRPVHLSNAREKYVFSGNGAGKSCMLVNEVLWLAQGYNPIKDEHTKVPVKIVYLVDDPDKIALTIIPEMKKWHELKDEWMRQEGKPHISLITFPNGSTIKFLSHAIDQLKAEGIQLDVFAADEPPPYHLYTALTRGMREKGSIKRTIIVGTPLAEPWLRTKIYEPWKKGLKPEVECFKVSSEVNKEHLDWKEQERFFSQLSEHERKIRMEGAFFDLSGAALAHLWNPDKHLVAPFNWPKNWPCVVAIDPAQSKPHVAVMLGVNPKGELYYIKEMSLRAPAREFAERLLEWMAQYPVHDIVCDSLGNSGMSGGEGLASFIDILNEAGVRCRPTTYADKSDEVWINGIQDALYCEESTMPKLRIFEGNYGIIDDIENVQWLKIRHSESFKPKLDISKKDYLACLKYCLASNPIFVYNSGSGQQRVRTYASAPVGNFRSRERF